MTGVEKIHCIESGDTGWVLISTVLILGMMPGLGLFEAGLLRAKSTVSVLTQCFAGMMFLSVMWFVVGFTLTFGPDQGGFIGNFHYTFLVNVPADDCLPQAGRIPGIAYATFEMMFATITPLLLTGTYAERISFLPFILLTVFWEILVYYPLAHWVWGGGWLAQLGVIDFAGGIVIHTSAGAAAVVAASILGHRKDFDKYHGEFPASSLPLATIGGVLLWMGWFGFNAGSALVAGEVAATTVMNTQIASATSGTVWLIVSLLHSHNQHSVVDTLNGAIAGLAGITPASGYVTPQAAFCIGIILGLASYFGVETFKVALRIDDALDVSSVHGLTGVIGSIAIGFAGTTEVNRLGQNGLFYGNPRQLWVQIVGVLVAAAWAGFWTYIIMKVISWTIGLRVESSYEELGVDYHEHGVSAYERISTRRSISEIRAAGTAPANPTESPAEEHHRTLSHRSLLAAAMAPSREPAQTGSVQV